MKNIIAMTLVFMMIVSLVGCRDTKTINGQTYDTYGFINADEKKNSDIKYKIIIGNVVWSIFLSETIIAPIYFFGFSIYEPVGEKDHTKPKGVL